MRDTEPMRDFEARCVCCGLIMNKYWMERIDTGRNTQYLCPGCFKSGAKQADYITKRPGRPAFREAENK